MESWMYYALMGTVFVMIAFIALIMAYINIRKAKKILGGGVLSKVMDHLFLAGMVFVVYIVADILSASYRLPILYSIRGSLMVVVPFILLYAVWTVKKYADRLKELAE